MSETDFFFPLNLQAKKKSPKTIAPSLQVKWMLPNRKWKKELKWEFFFILLNLHVYTTINKIIRASPKTAKSTFKLTNVTFPYINATLYITIMIFHHQPRDLVINWLYNVYNFDSTWPKVSKYLNDK